FSANIRTEQEQKRQRSQRTYRFRWLTRRSSAKGRWARDCCRQLAASAPSSTVLMDRGRDRPHSVFDETRTSPALAEEFLVLDFPGPPLGASAQTSPFLPALANALATGVGPPLPGRTAILFPAFAAPMIRFGTHGLPSGARCCSIATAMTARTWRC